VLVVPSFGLDDRIALHELAARYGNTIDARDWNRFRTVFTADCRYELRGFGRLDTATLGIDALVELMTSSSAHPVAHHVTNVEVDATHDPVRMFSKIVGTLPAGGSGSADYHDIVVRTDGGWRIAERIVTLRRPIPPPTP
jgi:SnoaL-like domain